MKTYEVHPDHLAEGVLGSAQWTKVYVATEADAEIGRLKAEIQRLRGALKMIEEETLCPDAFPDTWDSYSEDQQLHITALLIAGAALEGTSDQPDAVQD